MIRVKDALVYAGVTMGLLACSSDDDKEAAIKWSDCEGSSSLQCASLQVPMDYSDADGQQISLALIRRPAAGNSRQGALLFNPGGPGGSGLELIRDLQQENTIPASILSAYDIVGFDPRGVGGSTPVDCTELGMDDISPYPIGEAAVREVHQQLSAVARACQQQEGRYLQQLGSMNVVRDMDEIRKALGEDKLNFVGYSYGSRLAALYLQHYPTSSGRIILDGSVLPDSALTRLVRESLPVMQSNLNTILARCANTNPQCSVDRLNTRLVERIAALSNDNTEDALEEFEVFGQIVLLAAQDPTFGLFASDTIIAYLESYEVAVLAEFVAVLEALGEDFDDDDADGDTAQVAVMCADDPHRPSADDLAALLNEFNGVSDAFAEAQLVLAAMCAGWPTAVEPLATIATDTAPLSLVIGGTTDAQTPLQWSEEMATAIGGLYIRSAHPGHTVVFTDESDCIDELVENFLLQGQVPTVTECE